MEANDTLMRRLEREEKARRAAERLAEERALALQEAKREAQQLAADLQQAREQAVAQSAAKSAWIADLSHEIRTPLNAIIGYGEMLNEDLRASEFQDLAHDAARILSAGNYLLVLINDLVDLEKIEAGQLATHPEDVDVAPVLWTVIEIIRPQLEANKNTLELAISPDVSTLHTDATRLRQILHNLLSNACKFTREGKIRVEIGPEMRGIKRYMVFEVRDSGTGMSAEQLGRIFDRFPTADASLAQRFGGAGIGLALTRSLCQLLGGDITAVSRPGHGSTFRFWLPWERRIGGITP